MSGDAVLRAERLNFWYGKVVALNDVSLEIGPGVTGILGPNGAGKTSLMRMAVGLLRPAAGTIRVLGEDPWNNPRFNLRVGYCPEHDGFFEWLTGRAFVRWLLRVRGFSRAEARRAADAALERVSLLEAADRRVGTYSRGMRQRLKLAQAVAHGSELLVLDEPLTGTDPLVRRDLIALIASFVAEGRHVLVSSHVLHEIEALTRNIVLVHRGRLVAFGDRGEIRALIDKHPHTVEVRATRARELAAALVRQESVVEVGIAGAVAGAGPSTISVRTTAPDAFYSALPRLALEAGCEVEQIASPDDDLEAVFRYLTA
ncbi:MAG TPA: ABC transporter ATP-binding protein [Planctomycetota bacterium]|nr:ABC transporter ATP-binding protein [Planctomycetota bacterium]